MVHTVDDYLLSLQGPAREWVDEYVRFMRLYYPDVSEGITYQIPTYKYGNNVIAFSATEQHFTFHTPSPEWLSQMKNRLPFARFGKGTAKIPFDYTDAKPVLFEVCHNILKQ